MTVSQADAPSAGEVGTDLSATFVLTQLYQNPAYEQWTIRGETELQNVTWTVQLIDQAGNQLAQPAYDNQTFDHRINISSGASEVRVSVTGTVPPITNYTYDPAESFRFAELVQARQGGTSDVIQSYEARHYTDASREARQAIDAAQSAIESAGGHQQAQRTLDSAINAYESENFDNAVNLAGQAEETADRARANRSRNQLILTAVGVVVLVGVLVGAVLYWRRTRTQSRL